MIEYDLQCDAGHRFSSVFKNMATYDQLRAAGHLVCSHCGSSEIEKAPMAPAIVQGRSSSTPTARDIEAFRRSVWEKIETHSTDVGEEFTEAIRDGQIGIHGTATLGELLELREEGHPVVPLPPKPMQFAKRRDVN